MNELSLNGVTHIYVSTSFMPHGCGENYVDITVLAGGVYDNFPTEHKGRINLAFSRATGQLRYDGPYKLTRTINYDKADKALKSLIYVGDTAVPPYPQSDWLVEIIGEKFWSLFESISREEWELAQKDQERKLK